MDEQSREALEGLVEQTGDGQSELVRRALVFYAANFQAANTDFSGSLEEYHRMLTSGEHVLLDIDFMHCLLEYAVASIDDPDSEFVEAVHRIAQFHAIEYTERFKSVKEILDWLSFCGFLTVRESGERTYHVVFPSQELRWFMIEFINESTIHHSFDLQVDEGVSKVIIKEIPPSD